MQSSSQIVTTNKPTPAFFTGWMPFLSHNQLCRSTEGKYLRSWSCNSGSKFSAMNYALILAAINLCTKNEVPRLHLFKIYRELQKFTDGLHDPGYGSF